MSYKKLKIACIILASGKSERFGGSKPKIFYKVHGTPIIEITLKNIIKYLNRNSIYITIPKKITKNERILLSRYTNNRLISGGKTRFQSLKNALNNINSNNYEILMVHDAARPNIPKDMMLELLTGMINNKYHCSVPASVMEDTIRKNNKTLNKKEYKVFQTPQFFNLNHFIKNMKKTKFVPTDDLGVIEHNKNLKIKYVQSSKQNIKITKKEDIDFLKHIISSKIKYSNGFDVHKLKKGNFLSLAGLKIKSKYQAIGHSDGDVVIHSIIDALLGANSKGDIGKYFPPLNKYKNISSVLLLQEIKKKIKLDYTIVANVDCTIICQKIRLEKYKKEIAESISSLLECSRRNINIKAKTADNVGTIGRSKAIACWTTMKLINL